MDAGFSDISFNSINHLIVICEFADLTGSESRYGCRTCPNVLIARRIIVSSNYYIKICAWKQKKVYAMPKMFFFLN
jgi:hypothetical protein